MKSIIETINWRNLIVTDSDNDEVGTLGWVVDNCPANLDNAIIRNGEIAEWYGFFISAPGEVADDKTPSVPVDWDGFVENLNIYRGAA